MLLGNGPNAGPLTKESDMTTTMTRDDLTLEQIVPERAPAGGRQRWLRRSIAGLALAGGLAVLGSQMAANANFSERYVTEQLARQRITFKAADALTDEERKHACVVANAGKPLLTGKQAECYANEFIGTHVVAIGKGRTYAEMEDVRTALTRPDRHRPGQRRPRAAQAPEGPRRAHRPAGGRVQGRDAPRRPPDARSASAPSARRPARPAPSPTPAPASVALLSLAGLARSRRTTARPDRR